MAWPSATYDIISRIYSNWPSLNLSQNACEGKNEKLLKTSGADVLSSRKKTKKNLREIGGGTPPPHLYVRRLKQNAFVSLRPDEEICFIYAH